MGRGNEDRMLNEAWVDTPNQKNREESRSSSPAMSTPEHAFVTALARWAAREDYRRWRRGLKDSERIRVASEARNRTCNLEEGEYEEIKPMP